MKVTRRSSSFGNSSLGRRSSVNAKDVERIQQVIQKRFKPSPQLLFCTTIFSPPLAWLILSLFRLHAASFATLWASRFALEPLFLDCQTAFNAFAAVLGIQLIFVWIIPSDDYTVKTPSGEEKVINANSFTSSLLTVLLYVFCATLKLYDGRLFYVHFAGICCIFSGFCVLVVFAFCYASKDDSNEPLIMDFFYGRELQPKVLDIDIKNLITNRLSLTFWALYAISSLYEALAVHGKLKPTHITLVGLQLFYIARRQWTEHLSFANLDAQNDRAGFCRLWGAGVFLLILHSTPLSFLASTPMTRMKWMLCIPIVIINLFFQYTNSDADLQKYNFRAAHGKLKINNKDPFFILAKYRTENNEPGVNLLLGSGYFATCRHPNYLSELLTFVTWSLLQKSWQPLVHISPILLGLLLYIRMMRDEVRCFAKYNNYWLQYCNKVQYLAIPGVI